MRFLIVDDSAFMRSQIKKLFSAYLNILFEEATDGIEALEKHRSFKPDVMVLDYIISAPDGLAVLKVLSRIDKNIKVIMVTTLGKQKDFYKDCLEFGAFAILTKPVDRDSVAKIAKRLGLQEKRQ